MSLFATRNVTFHAKKCQTCQKNNFGKCKWSSLSAQNPFTFGTIAQLLMMEANDGDSELPTIDLISRRFDLDGLMETSSADSTLCIELQPRFGFCASPPIKPQDPFFNYEATTLFAMAVEPGLVGDLLLDFFEQHPETTFTKNVNHNKFSFKVGVKIMDLDCTVKTRVYKEFGKKYAIEFQHRAGDSICFNALYKRALKYIGQRVQQHSSETLCLCHANDKADDANEQDDGTFVLDHTESPREMPYTHNIRFAV
jgi:hypothetical protein